VRKLIAIGKSLIDWGGTAFTVVGWLGWTPAIIGIFAAVGGAIWAVVRGVPVPIAIMAGYCTIAGAVVLTMVPLAYRAFSRMGVAPVPRDAVTSQKPNAAVWQHLPKFSLYQAACLLADVTPVWKIPEGDAQAWYNALRAEIQSRQVAYIHSSVDNQRTWAGAYHPDEGTQISREELQRFAERHGIRPRFLFPD
jgi:hypothetical protein